MNGRNLIIWKSLADNQVTDGRQLEVEAKAKGGSCQSKEKREQEQYIDNREETEIPVMEEENENNQDGLN